MILLPDIIYLLVLFAGSCFLTGYVRKYCLLHNLVDIPNQRSSHQQPTPRGGGLSIAAGIVVTVIYLWSAGYIAPEAGLAIGAGCLLVAAVGWADDKYNLNAGWRMFLYTLASLWALYWLHAQETGSNHELMIFMNIQTYLLPAIGMVWLTNLYNFMDGTDALAMAQAVCAGLMGGFIFYNTANYGLAVLCWAVVASSAGFGVWNWPPAKIFMGDVGSCTLGFGFGALALAGEKYNGAGILIWAILLSVFISDATLTLIMRICKKEKWYAAHRSHAYQKLTQMGISHRQLVTGVILMNIILIWPAACIASYFPDMAIWILLTVYFVCLMFWALINTRFAHMQKM